MYYYYSYGYYFPNEIFFRIVRYIPLSHIVVIDFIDSIELEKYNNLDGSINLELGPSTMILLKNYKQKKLREGACYSIKTEVIRELFLENASVDENSFVFGLEINLIDNALEVFYKTKSFSEYEEFFRNFYFGGGANFDHISEFKESKYRLVVRNVGQGNWNELYDSESCFLIYDIGTSMFYSKSRVAEICADRLDLIKKENPILIISHWDIDHYHCLFSMDDDILKSFRLIICPSFAPSLSSRLILSRFTNICNDKLITFEINKPTAKVLYNPLVSVKKGKLIFFLGCKHRDRNRSGILLAINLRNKGAILTGDHYYDQVSNCVLPEIISKEHCLVVPHHGGKAGRVEYNLRSSQFVKEAIISVGHNHYGHPLESTIDDLRKIGFKIYQTRFLCKDIEIELN